MAQSGRFSLSLRILAVLAAAPEVMHTSAAIAEELSESAVVVRRYFLLLEKRGLIEQRRGPGGGAKLRSAAREIGLGDVYLAAESDWLVVEDLSISSLLGRARKDGVSAMNEITLDHILKRMNKKPIYPFKAGRRSATGAKPGGGLDQSFAVDVRRTLRSLIPAAEVRPGSYAWK